jgi:hemerythrin-like domain-containing protein
MAEHVEIINATGQLRAAVGSGEEERVEVTRGAVAALLWPHTSAEEDGLFRVLHRDEQFAAHIDGLCEEHTSLDQYLEAITPGDEVAMAQFENALRDHIDKEDNGLFPAAAIALNGDQWTEVHAATPHQHGEHTHAHA